MENGGIIGVGTGFAAFFGFVVYANVVLSNREIDLDASDEALAQCHAELAEVEKKTKRATADRDTALAKLAEAERLMRSSHVQATQEAFSRLRAEDEAKYLREETERLRASLSMLKAAAIETASIGKIEPRRQSAHVRYRPRTVQPDSSGPHEWFRWATPRP